MFFSFLILTRNRLDELELLIQSINNLNRVDDFEIIVLDNGSDHPLNLDIISEKSHKNIRLLRSDVNLGVPGGRNLLAHEASGEWLFFIDDDAFFVQPDMLIKTKEYIVNHSRKLGAIACNIREYYKPWQYYYPFSKQVSKKLDLSTSMLCSYFIGGAHLIKKQLFIDIGGYDPRLFFFGEELELSYKLINFEFEIHYVPNILVIHKRSKVKNLLEDQRTELILKNKIYLNNKYLPTQYRFISDIIWSLWHIKNSKKPWMTLKALVDGKRMVEKKELLTKDAIDYLSKNHGRLYY